MRIGVSEGLNVCEIELFLTDVEGLFRSVLQDFFEFLKGNRAATTSAELSRLRSFSCNPADFCVEVLKFVYERCTTSVQLGNCSLFKGCNFSFQGINTI